MSHDVVCTSMVNKRTEILNLLSSSNQSFNQTPSKNIITLLTSLCREGRIENIPLSELSSTLSPFQLSESISHSILRRYIRTSDSSFSIVHSCEFLAQFDPFSPNSDLSYKEKTKHQENAEIHDLLTRPTAKELLERGRGGVTVQHFCKFCTREDCPDNACGHVHFMRVVTAHTDDTLGDCSYLNTCFHVDTCKYVHYEVEKLDGGPGKLKGMLCRPPQWIQCDIRNFDLSILGQFGVIMADPPWDIHMDLPYGTMTDDEIRNLPIVRLQTEGFIFLWVTGRAMELGRGLLRLWKYRRVGELIWVKTNQLHRVIRTGRTGHWLNHAKEHCLIGQKGDCGGNGGLDCDVIASEVRETSRKPDEIYALIERLSPGSRKLELFGRPHNTQINWLTLGDQIDGVRLCEPSLVAAYRDKYDKH